MLNIGRHFLKKQQHEELQRLREEQPKREKPLPRFLTWLKTRSLQTAGLWNFRRRIKIGMEMKPLEFQKIGDIVSPYRSYRETLLRQSSKNIDPSRLDAMIALWVCVTGYSRGFVATEIGREAQSLRQEDESRDWHHYAREVSYYAFGPAGDIDIATFGPTPEKILNFHWGAKKLEVERMGEIEPEREAPRLRMR